MPSLESFKEQGANPHSLSNLFIYLCCWQCFAFRSWGCRRGGACFMDHLEGASSDRGDQEGAAWNRHFDRTCCHPNFLFNQIGMLERAALRSGNVQCADGWRAVLDPVIARSAGRDFAGWSYRACAAYAIPAICERREEAGCLYAIRLPAITVLKEKIAYRLTRPVGRPSQTKVKRFYEDVQYQAASWDKEGRVIAKIEWHPGERFPRVGVIVTKLAMDPDWVALFNNQRGTAEQHIEKGTHAFGWTRLSCRRFRDTEVRLALHALAFTFGHRHALHCAARGSDRSRVDQSPTQADQDRGPCHASRPRHPRPAGQGRGHGADGARQTCGDPPTASASIMRITAIPHQTKRKRQDSSVRNAQQRRCKAGKVRAQGLISPALAICATTQTPRTARNTNPTARHGQSSRPTAGSLGKVGGNEFRGRGCHHR